MTDFVWPKPRERIAQAPSDTAAAANEAQPPTPAVRRALAAAATSGGLAGLRQYAVPYGAPPGLQGRRLQELSSEPLRRVASFLPGADRLELAATRVSIFRDLGTVVDSVRLTRVARGVRSLAEFQATLGGAGAPVSTPAATVRGLPASQRSDSLSALARCIHKVASDDAQAALAEFRGAVAEMSGESRTPELVELDRIASYGIGTAAQWSAARAGENVQQIAFFHGVFEIAAITILERRSFARRDPASAGSAAMAGGNVQVIAAQYGLTGAEAIRFLERRNIRSDNPTSAAVLVRSGHNVQEAAHRNGITTEDGIRELQEEAVNSVATAAVMRGEDVQTVIHRHGITLPFLVRRLSQEGEQYQLALAAANAAAAHAAAAHAAGAGTGQP